MGAFRQSDLLRIAKDPAGSRLSEVTHRPLVDDAPC